MATKQSLLHVLLSLLILVPGLLQFQLAASPAAAPSSATPVAMLMIENAGQGPASQTELRNLPGQVAHEHRVGLRELTSVKDAQIESRRTRWQQLAPSLSPAARYGHAMVYDSDNDRMVIFGGSSDGFAQLNDTWEFEDGTYREAYPTASPPGRLGHAMVYDSRRHVTVLFGGLISWGSGWPSNDTWEYDGATWRLIALPLSPPPRHGHAMVYDSERGVVVLFGGCTSYACNSSNELADTWQYDGRTWTQIYPSTSPAASSYHAMAFDTRRRVTVLFGGSGGDETWEFDGDNWTCAAPVTSPPATLGHILAYDQAHGLVLLYGRKGADCDCDDCSIVWEYDGITWAERIPGGPAPQSRRRHTMAFDSSGRALLFGGHACTQTGNSEPVNDSWWYLALSSEPAIFYVDAANDTGIEDGSLEHPFRAIGPGVITAVGGDTVQVAPGVYRENVVMRRTVHVQSESGPDATIIEGGRDAAIVACADQARIQGFTIRSGVQAGTHGIKCGNVSPVIMGNHITDVIGYGIWLVNSPGGEIAHNYVRGDPVGFHDAIHVGGGVTIHHNVIDGTEPNNNISAIDLFDSSMDTAFVVDANMVIGRMTFWEAVGDDARPNRITNNVILAQHPALPALDGSGSNAGPTLVIHNTIVGAVSLQSEARVRLHNNIVTGQLDAHPEHLLSVCYNNLAGGTVSSLNLIGVDGNFRRPPSFVDAPGGNYRLTGSDPGIDRGGDTDLVVDFDGNARNQDGDGDGVPQPDPGAFEKPTPTSRLYFPWVAIGRTGPSPYNNPAALQYSSYVLYPVESYAWSYKLDHFGRLWIAGTATSADFPTTDGAFDRTFEGETEAFVARFSADHASIEYATFLGGSRTEYGTQIDFDLEGNTYVVGLTNSPDFPTTPGAFDPSFDGNDTWDVFVVKLNADGTDLHYGTFISGSYWDFGYHIFVDEAGNATVAGQTYSMDFPTTPGAFARTHAGQLDLFISKLNAAGSELVYSTFMGGRAQENIGAVVAGRSGDVYLTGYTNSGDFPTTAGAYDTSYNGGFQDGFTARLRADGSSLIYATFLGGQYSDSGVDVAVADDGRAIVAGTTTSYDFPVTPGAFRSTFSGPSEGFALRLNANGADLQFSTFLGGNRDDSAWLTLIDDENRLCAAGRTTSSDLLTTEQAFDRTCGTEGSCTSPSGDVVDDSFFLCLDADGRNLAYATYLGGSEADQVRYLLQDRSHEILLVGRTNSEDFPTTPGSAIPAYPGVGASFITRLSLGPNYRSFIGAVERPKINQLISGAALISGYAIDLSSPLRTGVDSVHIYLDGPYGTGAFIGAAQYGQRRSDVAALYGPQFALSGWELAWDTSSTAPGSHELYIYAHRTTDDGWSLMDPHAVIVAGGPTRWLPIGLRNQ